MFISLATFHLFSTPLYSIFLSSPKRNYFIIRYVPNHMLAFYASSENFTQRKYARGRSRNEMGYEE